MKYRNVTISGLPGSGSSTLGRSLAQKLGWEYFSGGEFMRNYAIEKGFLKPELKIHHLATVYNDEFDREVDYRMRGWLKEKQGKVLDSWLSGFLAQGTEGTLKVLMKCSNDEIRIDRLVNRDGISVEEAKKHVFEREEKNLKKWTRMYQKEWRDWVGERKIDFYHPSLYDLVIDTYSLDRDSSLKKTLKVLEAYV
ncbi:MAG: cytidylate kinase family protein [Patescibacteria group bacterium]|nr:cytidylate kinase family protein [Patescibacteria group bacterium]